MVDAAAALWSVVPTPGMSVADAGWLAEDRRGGNTAAEDGLILNAVRCEARLRPFFLHASVAGSTACCEARFSHGQVHGSPPAAFSCVPTANSAHKFLASLHQELRASSAIEISHQFPFGHPTEITLLKFKSRFYF
jgi:hypothetical protein